MNSRSDISITTDPGAKPEDSIDLALNALQPNERKLKAAKFEARYPLIEAAIKRGVTQMDIRKTLASSGISLSAATFKKLLESARQKHSRLGNGGNNSKEEHV